MVNKSNKNKQSKKGLLMGISIAAAVLLLIAGLKLMLRSGTDNYLSATVTKETIETYYTFTGNVDSSNTQNVMAEKILQISQINVSEGDKVTTDDVIFVATDGTEVKSKIEGTINKIFVEVDQQVMSGGQLCQIIDLENLEVSVRVDEYDLSCIEIG